MESLQLKKRDRQLFRGTCHVLRNRKFRLYNLNKSIFNYNQLTMKTERRSVIKKMVASVAGLTGLGLAANAKTYASEEKETLNVTSFQDVPLFSGSVKFGNLVFVAGKGAHVSPFEIKAHTEIVLKALEEELVKAGSSMGKVLKVTVYLNDIADYKSMNEVYKGRFGKNPPVRTTVAVAKGGVPGDSLVEMDCIAYV
jgi:2-iminobutanoate/2-iminopropanoate deaminase